MKLGLFAIVTTFSLLLTACSTTQQRVTKLTASAAPALQSSPAAAAQHPERHWYTSEDATATDPNLRLFTQLRQAYWNYNNPEALRLLQQIKPSADGVGFWQTHWEGIYGNLLSWPERQANLKSKGEEPTPLIAYFSQLPEPTYTFTPTPSALPFTLKRGTLVTAEIEIGGIRRRFLFDTGCGKTMITRSLARRLNLKIDLPAAFALSDSNNVTRQADITLSPEIKIGPLSVKNFPIIVTSHSSLVASIVGLDGIIGWDLLQHIKFTWDFPARQMTLAPTTATLISEPNLSGREKPILQVLTAKGRSLDLFYDSGWALRPELYDAHTLLETKVDLPARSRDWRPSINFGAHSFRIVWPKRYGPFVFWLADHRFEIPYCTKTSAPDRDGPFRLIDGLIGNEPFLTGRLTLDAHSRSFTFEPTQTSSALLVSPPAESRPLLKRPR